MNERTDTMYRLPSLSDGRFHSVIPLLRRRFPDIKVLCRIRDRTQEETGQRHGRPAMSNPEPSESAGSHARRTAIGFAVKSLVPCGLCAPGRETGVARAGGIRWHQRGVENPVVMPHRVH